MFHGRRQLGQRFLDGVDLMIDFATLGEYGLEPLHADGFRERADRRPRPSRRPGWEAHTTTRRGACGQGTADAFRFPGAESRRPVDFRAAVDRFAA